MVETFVLKLTPLLLTSLTPPHSALPLPLPAIFQCRCRCHQFSGLEVSRTTFLSRPAFLPRPVAESPLFTHRRRPYSRIAVAPVHSFSGYLQEREMPMKRKGGERDMSMKRKGGERDMFMKRKESRKGPSSSADAVEETEEPRIDIRSILKDMEFLESSHMTWKQKKDLENRKVVSLGGKAPKKQRLPLSVARVAMKKQKERDEKALQERAILGRFGAFSSSSGGRRELERRRPEDRILKSTEGNFRNGVLDVKHMLQSSAPAPQASNDKRRQASGKGKKKKGGNKGQGGKRKGGGGKKRH